jgi:hypothetical protein
VAVRGLTLVQVDKGVLAELPAEVAAELRAGLPASGEPFAKAGNLRGAEPSGSSGSSSEEEDTGAAQSEEGQPFVPSPPAQLHRRPQSARTPTPLKRKVSDPALTRRRQCTAAALPSFDAWMWMSATLPSTMSS